MFSQMESEEHYNTNVDAEAIKNIKLFGTDNS